MSDAVKQKASPEESLAMVYVDMFKTMLYFAIGWVVFMYCIYFTGDFGQLIGVFLGGGIAAGPIGWAILTGAGVASLFKADYEVVTKDSNGNVVSRDGGHESRMNNLFIGLVIVGLIIALGIFVQLIRFTIQTIKYIYYYAKCSMKPTFLKSGYAIIVAGFIILIGVPSVFSIPKNMADAAERKKADAALVELAKTYPILGYEDRTPFMARVNEALTVSGYGDLNIRQGAEIYVYGVSASSDGSSVNITFYNPPEQRPKMIRNFDDLNKLTYIGPAPRDSESPEYKQLFGTSE